MQTSIIVLLVICLYLAVQGYYFGFIRPPRVFAWLQQATFVFMAFLMIPFLAGVLWLQSGAENRLARVGIVPHPSIEETVGVAMGVGDNPIWMSTVDAPAESIADFYRTEANRQGWNLTNDSPTMLILNRGEKKMVIGVHEGWDSRTVTYTLTE